MPGIDNAGRSDDESCDPIDEGCDRIIVDSDNDVDNEDYFEKTKGILAGTRRNRTLNARYTEQIDALKEAATKNLSNEEKNELGKMLYHYTETLASLSAANKISVKKPQRKSLITSATKGVSTDTELLRNQEKNLQLKKTAFEQEVSCFLHSHNPIILKIILGLSAALFTLYITGGLELAYLLATKSICAATANTSITKVAEIALATCASAAAFGYKPVPQFGYAVSQRLGFFALDAAVTQCSETIYDTYKPIIVKQFSSNRPV